MSAKIILFEMNEIPLKILEHYAGSRPRSHVARALRQSRVYQTWAEDSGHLSPWITWPSLHRGVPDQKHFIANFGQPLDEVDRAYPTVWSILRGHGVDIGIGGSLHTYPVPADPTNLSFYIPDIFAAGDETLPASLQPFQSFCLGMARESGRNVATGVPVAKAAALVKTLPQLGIKPRTVASIGRQLLAERRDAARLVRRRTFQAVLSFDVFMRQLRRTKPQFTTFFTNHVASAMHRYWAASFPDEYQRMAFDEGWRATYGGEIAFAMDRLDEMIGDLVAFVDRNPGYELLMASSMGQEAVESEPIETQLYLTDARLLLDQLGLAEGEWSPKPAMLPQYNLTVEPAARDRLIAALDGAAIGTMPFGYQADGLFFSLNFGHANLGDPPVTIGGRTMSLGEAGLANVEIQDRSNTTAYHIPQGSLLAYRPGTTAAPAASISALEIAPYILSQFGVAVPEYMMRAPVL